jgi:methanethiol S-methyltransferase
VDVLWLVLAVAAWGGLHSLLASRRAKQLFRDWFGPEADRFYRLGYNLFSVVSFLPLLGLVAILPDSRLYSLPVPWVFLTLAGQGLAVLILVVGLLQTGAWDFIGLRQVLSRPDDRPPGFVTGGLYRWVRHPLYTAGLVFIWLTPVMTVNLLIFYAGLSLYIVIGAVFEERKLLGEFGPAYAAYQASTPMLIPGLKWNCPGRGPA